MGVHTCVKSVTNNLIYSSGIQIKEKKIWSFLRHVNNTSRKGGKEKGRKEGKEGARKEGMNEFRAQKVRYTGEYFYNNCVNSMNYLKISLKSYCR